jgi:hypothetical protein
MPPKESHQHRWKSDQEKPLDKQPICFKGWKGQREKLRSVEGWQSKIRFFVEELITECD